MESRRGLVDVNPYITAIMAVPTAGLATLDAYTSGLWTVCWMRRLLSSYTGPLLRIRRSSDNTELDIGYAADKSLDSAAAVAFAGAGSAFVTKLYDQTGNTRDAVQATTTKQPRIVNSGVFDGKLVFDGTDDCLRTGNSGTPSIFSVVTRALSRSTAAQHFLLEHSNGAIVAAHSNAVLYNEVAGGQKTNQLITTGTSYRLNETAGVTIGGVMGGVYDYSQSTSNKSKLYKNGSLQSASTGLSGSEPSGSFTADPWNFGARNNGASGPAPIDTSGFVVWEGVSQAANMSALSTILSAGTA